MRAESAESVAEENMRACGVFPLPGTATPVGLPRQSVVSTKI